MFIIKTFGTGIFWYIKNNSYYILPVFEVNFSKFHMSIGRTQFNIQKYVYSKVF